MTPPSLTNPNPKREGVAAGYFDSLMQIVAWVREAQQIPQPENSISIDDVDADEIEAAAYFIDRISSPGDPVRAALEEARACLCSFTGGPDGACGETIAKIDAALSVSTPTGEGEEACRPCDCIRCDCGNVGDAAAVAAWDAEHPTEALRIKSGEAR